MNIFPSLYFFLAKGYIVAPIVGENVSKKILIEGIRESFIIYDADVSNDFSGRGGEVAVEEFFTFTF